MDTKKNRFKYMEIVTISEKYSDKLGINKKPMGTVLGYDNINNEWFYTIDIQELDEVISLPEKALIYTGNVDRENNFYDGSTINIKVDEQTGEGKIIDDDKE